MSPEDKRNNLKEQLQEYLGILNSSQEVLAHSYAKCKKIDLAQGCDVDQMESFEALTARFARTSDILTQKVIRALFLVLQENPKTFIDGANLLEKIEAIKKADDLFNIRQLRNEIAHEYSLRDINTLFVDVLKHVPLLFELLDSVESYIKFEIAKQSTIDKNA